MYVVQVELERKGRGAQHTKPHSGCKLFIRKLVKWLSSIALIIFELKWKLFSSSTSSLGPPSTPPGPLLPLSSHPSQMIDSWAMGAVTVSFFAFWGLFSSFLPHKGEKIRKGQWEGTTVLSTTSLRKKAFSAGSGGLKCQSGALRRLSLGLCGVKGEFQHLIPLACLGRASRPYRALRCLARLPDPFQTSPQQEKREAGLGRKGQERSDMAPWARQGWACSRVPQGFHREPRTVHGAGPPPLLEEAPILLLP